MSDKGLVSTVYKEEQRDNTLLKRAKDILDIPLKKICKWSIST